MNKPSFQVYYDSSARQNRILREIKELIQYRDLIFQMTMRNITVRYKRSLFGILWTLLEPIMTMLVMSFIFSALLSRKIPNFPVYLLSGLIVWEFFSASTNSAMRDFVATGRLVSRVYLPQSAFVMIAITTGLVNFMVEFVVLLVITMGITGSVSVYTPTLLFPILILTIFNTGVGLILAPLGVYFNDINSIYNIFLRLLLYLSAIFYPLDIMPNWLQNIVALNPVYQFIHIFRNPIYYQAPIPIEALVYTLVWAIGLLIFGAFLFTALSDDISIRI